MTRWARRPWDSEFFGLEIGQLAPGPITAEALAAVVDDARVAAIDCLYLLADADDAGSIAAAERTGFSLADVRLTMNRDAGPSARGAAVATRAPGPAAGGSIRAARPDDLAALKALARVSHRNTRFHRDRRFDRSRSDEMYAVWIERSVSGELANAVWVAEIDGQPRGYITVSRRDSGSAIGLVAVADGYRGRGHGERLLDAALAWSEANGMPRTSVVTQGTSAASVRFYERAGFTVGRVELWYHRWL